MTAELLHRSYRPPAPLDLVATLLPLRRGGAADPSLLVEDRTTVWRATRNADGPVTLRLRPVGDRVDLTAWGPGAKQALERAPTLLGGDDDWSGFEPRHPLVRELWRRQPGLRLCRSEAVMEALVPTVMEQKVIGVEARQGYRRLLLELGEPAPGPLPLRVPPAAAALSRLPYWRFHPFAVERRRAETIIRAARVGTRLEKLREASPVQARTTLATLPGIGPWSANEITLVALGDADAVSLGDYHLPNMVCSALAGEARGTDDRMLELLAPFAGHRGRVIRLLLSGRVRAPRFGPRLALRHLERH